MGETCLKDNSLPPDEKLHVLRGRNITDGNFFGSKMTKGDYVPSHKSLARLFTSLKLLHKSTMGKRYYCDYCNKTMAITPSIVRNHKNGIAHQKLVNEHYQQYKDPSTILREELKKKPCKKNATGECIFGSICYFSHYTPEEMNVLRQQVAAQVRTQSTYQVQPSFAELYNKLQMEKSTKPQKAVETSLFDRNGITYTFPWVYNEFFEMYGDSLPPSLKRLKIDDFLNANFTEWG